MLTLQCSEVWGGIRNENIDAASRQITTSLFSSAAEGRKGGDIYYFSVCAYDRLTRIAIADVVGHGAAVTTMSAWIYAALRDQMNTLEGERVLHELNRLTVQRGLDALTTAAVVSIYPHEREAQFAYAGHPPALLARAGDRRGRFVNLPPNNARASDLPLGVTLDTEYHHRAIQIGPGDRLLLYTDGVLEAPSPAGEPFGSQRLQQAADRRAAGSLADVKLSVLDALHQHTGGPLTHDDVTLVAVEVT